MSAIGAPRPRLLLCAIVATLAAAAASSATTRVVPSPATPTIASALAASANGDSVNVLAGTYYEHDLSSTSDHVTLRGVAGAAETIIDAQGLGRVFSFGESYGGVIEGLTLTHGAAGEGACVEAGPEVTIRGCVIADNHATGHGGAVHCGIGIGGFPLSLVDTVFDHNTAAGNGGALFTDNVNLTITACVFRNNAANSGGAVEFYFVIGQITDCVFVENTATYQGGALDFNLASVPVQGCTFVGNGAPTGGALAQVVTQVTRTVIVGTSTSPGQAAVTCSGSPTFSCCDLFGNSGGNSLCGTDGGGNFSLDPLFCDAAAGNFRLNENSPCLPGHHPNGVDCGGTIGALGVGCGVGTGVNGEIDAAPWSRVKTRYR